MPRGIFLVQVTGPVPVELTGRRSNLVDRLILNVDGASRGNPGPAAIGVTVKDENNRLLVTISETIGNTTNNQAEYRALIAGLEKAVNLGAKEVVVKSDSELLVKQLQGHYRVKNARLKPLYSEAVKLAYSLASFKIAAVPREQNREADQLANMALDR
jgi:ribonuclease HI